MSVDSQKLNALVLLCFLWCDFEAGGCYVGLGPGEAATADASVALVSSSVSFAPVRCVWGGVCTAPGAQVRDFTSAEPPGSLSGFCAIPL